MKEQTIYQRLRHAAATQTGMRLTPADVRTLINETDCRERAHRDDESALQGELPQAAPRAARAVHEPEAGTQMEEGVREPAAPTPPVSQAPAARSFGTRS
jgi:hypothetical protein